MKSALGEDRPPFVTGDLPAWTKTERWEIEAKLPANSIPAYSVWQLHVLDTPQINQMLQVLLEDRFRLKVHRETRELPGICPDRWKKRTETAAHQGRIHQSRRRQLAGGSRAAWCPDAYRAGGHTQDEAHFPGEFPAGRCVRSVRYFDRPVLDRTGSREITISRSNLKRTPPSPVRRRPETLPGGGAGDF